MYVHNLMSFNRYTYLCNCHHNLQNTIPKMFIFLCSQFLPTVPIPRRLVICFLSPQTSFASLAFPINGIIQYELLLWRFFYIAQCFFRIIHIVACVVLIVYSFLRNCQTMSQIDCTVLHSCHQWRVPVALHTLPNVVLLVFLIFAILTDVYLIVDLTCLSLMLSIFCVFICHYVSCW